MLDQDTKKRIDLLKKDSYICPTGPSSPGFRVLRTGFGADALGRCDICRGAPELFFCLCIDVFHQTASYTTDHHCFGCLSCLLKVTRNPDKYEKAWARRFLCAI